MARSPLVEALRADLAALQEAGAIDMTVLPAFDAALSQNVPADSRIADTRIDAILHGSENPR